MRECASREASKWRVFGVVASICLAGQFVFASPAWAKEATVTITIGTGSPAGVYYPTGQAVCQAVNKRTDQHGIHCNAVTTNGSVENAYKLRNGTLDFALMQSDVLFFATKGYGPFKRQGPDENLRTALTFFTESFAVVARPNAGIKSFDDLVQKRVNVGNPGSGQRASMDLAMLAKKMRKTDFASIKQYPSDKQTEALCNDEIDAFVFTAGHPNPSIAKATEDCGAVIVPLSGAMVRLLTNRLPFLKRASIPGGIYPGVKWSIPTFGTEAMFVTSTKLHHKIVYEVVKSVYRDLSELRLAHPAFAYVSPAGMATTSAPAPHHKGALRYFRDNGYSDGRSVNSSYGNR